MEFDQTTTAVAFLGLVALGGLALLGSPMGVSTIAMMVVPSMLVFGAICLFIGVKHGEYRAGA
jgi:hypothetical protein